VFPPHPTAGQTPARGHADVNGTRLYLEIVGSGPALVLVSGGGLLDRRAWNDQARVFARRFRVIRYDIRGVGQSARPTDNADVFAADFPLVRFWRPTSPAAGDRLHDVSART